MVPAQVIDDAINLIINGETIKAIQLLKANVSIVDKIYANLIELEGEANELVKDNMLGIISTDTSYLRASQIRNSVLSLIFGSDSQLNKTLVRERLKQKVKQSNENAEYEKLKKNFLFSIGPALQTDRLLLEYLDSLSERVLDFEKEFDIKIKCASVNQQEFFRIIDIADKGSIRILWYKQFAHSLKGAQLIFTLFNRPFLTIDEYIWRQTAQKLKTITFGITIDRDGVLKWKCKNGQLLTFDDLDEEIFALIADSLSR